MGDHVKSFAKCCAAVSLQESVHLGAGMFDLLKIHFDFLIFTCFLQFLFWFLPCYLYAVKTFGFCRPLDTVLSEISKKCEKSKWKDRSPWKETCTHCLMAPASWLSMCMRHIFQSECYFSLLARFPGCLKPLGRYYMFFSSEKKEIFLCLQSQDMWEKMLFNHWW